ncbi:DIMETHYLADENOSINE TRANSFERASE 1, MITOCHONDRIAL [Ceraceosorus bombacis]|uniref:rRNA adenine N(6)-methyltransferase n=1 Tax=Ceraceosorus bombacis TaxID=401625 RepID=A0A0P1BDY8_9BASI|nr:DIMETHYLADENOSINE TRANSFERASE 1, MITOCHONDRIAL [Ceraceosorus bombacis]
MATSTKQGGSSPSRRGKSKKSDTPASRLPTGHKKRSYTLEDLVADTTSDIGALERHEDFPHLPAQKHWKDVFSAGVGISRNRTFICDKELAHRVIEGLNLDEAEGQVTIVEAYPGPGILTRLLLEHPKVEKVIAMEDNTTYLPCIQALQNDPTVAGGPPGSKLLIEGTNPYRWEAHTNVILRGAFDHLQGKLPGDGNGEETIDVKAISQGKVSRLRKHDTESWTAKSQIIFLAQLPNIVYSEQLFAQLCHAIAHRQWYYQFTRVKMAFVCSEALANRALAEPGNRARAKLGVIVQSLADVTKALPASEFLPHSQKIYPSTALRDPELIQREIDSNQGKVLAAYKTSRLAANLSKRGTSLIIVDPKIKPLVGHGELDALEFITRNLFVLRNQTVEHALKHVAPGAENLLQHLKPDTEETRDHPERIILPDYIVMHLTNEQWAALARVFDCWPFRPQILIEDQRAPGGELPGLL